MYIYAVCVSDTSMRTQRLSLLILRVLIVHGWYCTVFVYKRCSPCLVVRVSPNVTSSEQPRPEVDLETVPQEVSLSIYPPDRNGGH